MNSKIVFTIKRFKETAHHHYDNNPLSLIKFIYSCLKINTFVIYELDLNKPLPHIELDSTFRVIKPTTDELESLRNAKYLPREFYYDKFHHVRTCYVALSGDEIAYIHWVYFKGDYSRFLKLHNNTAEINYLTTLPKFRGHKLSSQMLAFTSRDLKKLGFKKIVIVVHENTIAFIKNLRMAEFREVRRIKVLGPFGRRIAL